MDNDELKPAASNTAIVIACGGDGSRMGGLKPLRELCGETLAERMLAWAKAQSDLVAFAVREPGQVPGWGCPLLIDRHCGIGPISALASAFEFAQIAGREFVLLVGCDQPFLPDDLTVRLLAAIGDRGAAMPARLGQEQPLATLWRTDPASLSAYMAKGGQSLRRFAHDIGAAIAEWPAEAGDDPFLNVNDPCALAEAERQIRMGAR